MTIPISTTTVTVIAQAEAEPGAGITTSERAAGVRAHISTPNGLERTAPGGGTEQIDAILLADPIGGLHHTDAITDDQTGDVYQAAWVTQRQGLGLDHTRAGLVRRTGRAAA